MEVHIDELEVPIEHRDYYYDVVQEIKKLRKEDKDIVLHLPIKWDEFSILPTGEVEVKVDNDESFPIINTMSFPNMDIFEFMSTVCPKSRVKVMAREDEDEYTLLGTVIEVYPPIPGLNFKYNAQIIDSDVPFNPRSDP